MSPTPRTSRLRPVLRRWRLRLALAVRRPAVLLNPQAVVLAALLVVVGGVWAFIELADEVAEGETQRFDERALELLRDPADPARPVGPAWLEGSAAEITALGGTTTLTLTTIFVLGYLLLQRKFHATLFVLVAVVGGQIVSTALKHSFARPRPGVVPHLTHFTSPSFPSGHAMLSAVVYLTLGVLLAQIESRWRLRVYFFTLAVILTFLIGLSRVYLGVHYPTDVLAGWTAGLTWALLSWLAARWLQRRGRIERPAELAPTSRDAGRG